MKFSLLQLKLLFLVCSLLFVLTGQSKDSFKNLLHVNSTYTTTYNGVNYSSDHPYNLNVIYFVAKNHPLDPTYRKRLSALMLYGQNFYKQQMIANGYGAKTFGLFTQTANPDSVMIIQINGIYDSTAYTDADVTQQKTEINAYFSSHPEQKTSEHILVINAVSDPAHTHVPFSGYADRYCFALDYPQFDLQYLGAPGAEGDRMQLWYGGMLHELGHGLNLPHCAQTKTEDADPNKGMNLMWAGNYTLSRQPTFINRAGCAVLNNCQVFADAPGTSYYNGNAARLTSLHAVYSNGEIVLSGTFSSDKPVIDVNIYQDPYATPSQGYHRVAGL